MGGILEKAFKEINDWGHKVFGLSSPDHPEGTSANINISGSTSTDMGFDLEGKNTALTMGEMQPGEWTEMYGNNTAYQEEKNDNTNYVKDLIAPLLTGAATSYIDNYYNRRYQREQNEWNAQQSALDREWQEHMANTAHQREMADLLATGLNPVNTATGGGGAATGGGSTASGTTPPYMNTSGTVGNTALSLAETMKALSENKYISKEKKAQIANTVADTAQKEAGTGLTKAQTNESQARTEQAYETIKNLDADTKYKLKQAGYTEQKTLNAIKEHDLIIAQIENADTDTDVKKAEAEIKAWEARHPILARTFNAVGGVAGGVIGGAATGAARNVFTKKPGKIGF